MSILDSPLRLRPAWDFKAATVSASADLRRSITGRDALRSLTVELERAGIRHGTEAFAKGVCQLRNEVGECDGSDEGIAAIVDRIVAKQVGKVAEAARDAA